MPIITAAPIPVTGNPPRVTFGFGQSSATTLFVVAANQYLIVQDFNTNNFKALKSTDGGSTWTEMDSGHEPAATAFYFVAQVGAALQMVYEDNATGVAAYAAFDTGSDTWGAPVLAVDFITQNFTAANCPNGDWVILF